MAVDLKKMSFGQLAALGGGLFVVVMIIAGFVISASSKPPPKVGPQPAVREPKSTAFRVRPSWGFTWKSR